MPRLAAAMTAIILLSMPAAASAKDRMEPRAQAMLACASLTPDAARLRCYDQSILALKQALDQGDLVVNEHKQPMSNGGLIKASGAMGNNRYWVELESGDRWELDPTSDRNEAPRVGTMIKVRKFMGSFWAAGPSWRDSEAHYLGRQH